MLVCNVSMRPRHAAIAAAIAEAGAATDALTVSRAFAVLVDSPTAATDTVNAITGELLSEAASAAATIDAGLAYAVLIDEPATAADTSSGVMAGGIPADVAEAATADSAQDGTVISAVTAWSAMLPGVYVNADVPRQAHVPGIMVNL